MHELLNGSPASARKTNHQLYHIITSGCITMYRIFKHRSVISTTGGISKIPFPRNNHFSRKESSEIFKLNVTIHTGSFLLEVSHSLYRINEFLVMPTDN